MAPLLKKTLDGRLVFTKGRFQGKQLSEVQKEDPEYLKSVLKSGAAVELDDDAFYALKDAVGEG